MLQCIILEKKKPFCLQEHSFIQFKYLFWQSAPKYEYFKKQKRVKNIPNGIFTMLIYKAASAIEQLYYFT